MTRETHVVPHASAPGGTQRWRFPQLDARAARRADPRRVRHRFRRAPGRRPRRVPREVPQDGGLRRSPSTGAPPASSTPTSTRDRRGGPYLDERTCRVWIHGDLHAENFGTYMDANGRLVFNVNDFDEAYVGPFTWDLKRFAASVALHRLREGAQRRADQRAGRRCTPARTASASTPWPPAPRATRCRPSPWTPPRARCCDALRDARSLTRFGLLDSMTEIRDYERRFAPGGGVHRAGRGDPLQGPRGLRRLPGDAAGRVAWPARTPTASRTSWAAAGVGIGSAGLPSYNILLEGHSDALENDVVIYMKQAPDPGGVPAHHRPGGPGLLPARGPPHGDLAARPAGARRPVAGLDRAGRRRASWSPRSRRTRSTWTGRDIDEPGGDRRRSSPTSAGRRPRCTRRPTTSPATPWCRSPPSGPSTRRSPPTRTASRRCWSTSRTRYGARARADHQIFVDLFRNGRIPGCCDGRGLPRSALTGDSFTGARGRLSAAMDISGTQTQSAARGAVHAHSS